MAALKAAASSTKETVLYETFSSKFAAGCVSLDVPGCSMRHLCFAGEEASYLSLFSIRVLIIHPDRGLLWKDATVLQRENQVYLRSVYAVFWLW
jgi:hypothetical protein